MQRPPLHSQKHNAIMSHNCVRASSAALGPLSLMSCHTFNIQRCGASADCGVAMVPAADNRASPRQPSSSLQCSHTRLLAGPIHVTGTIKGAPRRLHRPALVRQQLRHQHCSEPAAAVHPGRACSLPATHLAHPGQQPVQIICLCRLSSCCLQ